MNTDLRTWIYTGRGGSRRPHLSVLRKGGFLLSAGILGFEVEVGICRAHSRMAHSIDEGRTCCRLSTGDPRKLVRLVQPYLADALRDSQ